ncbi:Pex12 amino terminal region-domain-containing protein [Peziza echinospora]|nr:Pex12 amino terminal region-domain-containing protein [Peziza echinospora]
MEFMSNVNSGLDENKPSLFELISETQLRDLLEPSARYILATITERHPRYLIHILNSYDEVYALVMLLVERHYLKSWGGSFTENFYGMKRERVLAVNNLKRASLAAPDLLRDATKLRKNDIWKSLFMVVGVPYLKRKLDDAYEIHAGGAAASLFGSSYRQRDRLRENATLREKLIYYIKIVFRKIYPIINAAYYISMLGFNLAYLFDKSHYHTPFHFLIKLRMRRLNEADHRAHDLASSRSRHPGLPPLSMSSLLNPIFLSRILLPKILDSLKLLLPTSIFFLKFLEWWHASDFARQLSAKTNAAIELPPPKQGPVPPSEKDVKNLPKGVKVVSLPEDSKCCPICKEEITNPTASQTGYVFCYPCVFKWIGEGGEGEGRCPVTGVKLLNGAEGLRRLMV